MPKALVNFRPIDGERPMRGLRLAFGLWFCSLGFMASPVLAETDEQRHAAELQVLQQRMQSVNRQIKSLRSELGQQQSQLRSVEKKQGDARRVLRDLQRQQQQSQSEISALRDKQHSLQADISQQQKLLAEQVRTAHAMGRQQRVKLVLNQQQPERISRMLIYYKYFNHARGELLQTLDSALQRMQALQDSEQREQRQLARLVERQQQQQQALDLAKQQRQQVIAGLNQEVTAAGGKLKKLAADEQRLQGLLASIRQAINDLPLSTSSRPFPELKGRLPWPTQGRLLNRYGSSRQAGRWDGVLIDAKEGQPVHSISHGRVVFADWLRGYGLLLIVDHGQGYMSLYAFNQSLYREVGDWVDAGEEIAAAGSSGGRDDAGLYFGIRKGGKPVNPAQWCRKIKRGRVG